MKDITAEISIPGLKPFNISELFPLAGSFNIAILQQYCKGFT